MHALTPFSISQKNSPPLCPPFEPARIEKIRDTALDLMGKFTGRFYEYPQCIPINTLRKELQEQMEGIREGMGFSGEGDKFSRLVEMHALTDLLHLPEPIVPEPIEISHEEVNSFLQMQAPEAFTHWEALCRNGSIDFASPHLEAMGERIQGAFRSAIFPFTSLLLQWLKKFKWVMVRSNCAEDGDKKSSNAGGNESKSFVEATAEAVQRAAGHVATSCGGRRSLLNRVRAGENPCEGKFRFGLFLQPVIGETRGQIPTSFVLLARQGIARLSMSFGHGEGVVANRGIATDTAWMTDALFLTKIARKPERLAPRPEGGLHKVLNPPSLVEEPSLSLEQMRTLRGGAELMQSLFGHEKGDFEGVANPRIHFVQERPWMVPEPLTEPTYFSGKAETSVRGEIAISGNAALVLRDPAEILFTETLEEANEKWKGEKLVLFTEPEPVNSHWIVEFIPRQIPCLYMPDAKMARELLERMGENLPLVACVQTGTLHLCPQPELSPGYTVYPEEIALSPPAPFVKTLAQAPSEIRDLLQKPQALSKLLSELRAKAASLKLFSPLKGVKERLQALATLDALRSRALQEIRQGNNQLFYTKVLEELFRFDDQALFRSIERLIDYQVSLPSEARCTEIFLTGEEAPNVEAYTAWKQLCQKLEASPLPLHPIEDYLSHLRKNKALPFWLTFLQPASPEELFEQIRLSDKAFLEEISQIRDQAPLETLASPSFLKRIKAAAPVDRSIAYQALRVAVEEKIDPMIKDMMKSSDPEKAESFKQILTTYFQFMENLATHLVPKGTFPENGPRRLDLYFEHLRTVLDNPATSDQLHLSNRFVVSASLISSESAQSVILQTLADLWTLIHQNILECLAALNHSLITEKSLLPLLLQEAMAKIEEMPRKTAFIGAEVKDGKICLKVNAVLRAHSGALELCWRNEELTLHAKILNAAAGGRLHLWAHLMKEAGIFPLERIVHKTEMEVSFFTPVTLENLGDLLEEYDTMARITLDLDFKEALVHFVTRWGDRKPHLMEKMIEIIQSGFGDEMVRITLNEFLVENRSAYEKVLEVTQATSKEKPVSMQIASLLIQAVYLGIHGDVWNTSQWKQLIEKEGVYEGALALAKSIPLERSAAIAAAHLSLLKTLVEAGVGYDFAFERAKATALSVDPYWEAVQTGFEILNLLVQKGFQWETIINIAKTKNFDPTPTTRSLARQLWRTLLKQGYGLEAAIKTMEELFRDPDLSRKLEALFLAKDLVQEGYGIKVAIHVAKDLIANSHPRTRMHALEVWKALFARGEAFEEALQRAQFLIKVPLSGIQSFSLPLWEELFKNGQGLDAAKKIAHPDLQRLLQWYSFIR